MSKEVILVQLASSAHELSASILGLLQGVETCGSEDIHEIRVATKRLRAYWLLAAPVVGRDAAKSFMNDLRDAARNLAAQRDEFVMIDLLRDLADRGGRKGRRAATFIAEDLFDAQVAECAAMTAHDAQALEYALTVDSERWASHVDDPGAETNETVVRDGFERTYARARDLGNMALILETAAGFHRWRRWVKYVYYQYSWLRRVFPDLKSSREARLKKLGSSLGRLHDVHHLWSELDCRSVHTSSPSALRNTRRRLISLEHKLVERVRRLGPKTLGLEPALVRQDIVEIVRSAESSPPLPALEFVSLANHEGNGIASSARAADAH